MKKIVAMLLTFVLLAGLLAGCGGGEKESKSVLKVATIEGSYNADAWKQVCDAFTAKTGIEVELTISASLDNDLQSGKAYDVVHLGADAAKGHTLSDLSGVLQANIPGESKTVADKLQDGLTQASALAPSGDGVVRMLPAFYQPCGLVYNADFFTQKRWEVPTTWDQMWMLADTALESGIYLFTYADEADLENFIYALAHNIGGQEFFDAVTNYEEGVWDTSNGRNFLKILTKLAKYTYPATAENANNGNQLLNQRALMENKVLFMPDGTWVAPELLMEEQSITTPFGWGMIAIPATTEGGDRYSHFDSDHIWIPADAAMKTEAEQFVAFMYSDTAISTFAQKGMFLPVKGLSSQLTGINNTFYSQYDNGCKLSIGGFTEHSLQTTSVDSVFYNGFSQLVSGNITANEFTENIKTATDLMRANLAG